MMKTFRYNINDDLSIETEGDLPYSEIEVIKIGDITYPGNRIFPAWRQTLVSCNGDLPERIYYVHADHNISVDFSSPNRIIVLKNVRHVLYDKDAKEIVISYQYFVCENK